MTRRWPAALPVLCLVAATWMVYGRAAAAGFVTWDDPDMLLTNPRLVPPTLEKTAGFWGRPCEELYTPLAYTLWSGVVALQDKAANQPLSPVPFHVLNVLLHTAAATFVFLLLRQLVEGVWSAWLGAMVFALHPLQVEPVAWASGMNNVLCGALSLAALWQYVLYAKRLGDRTGSGHLAIATLLYAAALLSKPIAVVVPLLAGALDLWVLNRPLRRMLWPLSVWAGMGLVMGIVARQVQPVSNDAWPSLGRRLFVAVDAIGFYSIKLFAPVNLGIDYERTPWWVLDHAWVAWPGFVILLPAVLCILSPPTRWMRAGLLIVPIALLPVVGLMPFHFQRYSTVADRYMYLPMFGVALLAAWAMQRARGHMIPWAVAGILLALLAGRSLDQLGAWRDTGTLAAQEFRLDQQNVTGHKILAAWLAVQGDDRPAEGHFLAAIAGMQGGRGPTDWTVWYDYGNLLAREGRLTEAIEQYRQALAHTSSERRVDAYNNLGIAMAENGDAAGAREQFLAALKLRPDDPNARKNLERLGDQ